MENVTIIVQPNITEVSVLAQPNISEVNITVESLGIKGEQGDGFGVYASWEISNLLEIVFILPSVPKDYSKAFVFLNGVKQRFGIDYQINGALLTYISTEIPIKEGYFLEIQY
jgi:hypothetical protein